MKAGEKEEREPGWAMGTEAARGFFGYVESRRCGGGGGTTSFTNAAVEMAGRRVSAQGRQARGLDGKMQKFLQF